jgi:hypothetical protein
MGDLAGVASVAEQRELSDSLGVSSALMLGAGDMLKLQAAIDEAEDMDQVRATLAARAVARAPHPPHPPHMAPARASPPAHRACRSHGRALAQVQRVLRRLSMVPMTTKLDATTGMLSFMAKLQVNEALQGAVQAGEVEAISIADLISRILGTWGAQLKEEQRQQQLRELARHPPPKPARVRDPTCAACRGRHRAHTCGAT